MSAVNQYAKMGNLTIVPASDLIDVDSPANVKSAAVWVMLASARLLV